MKAAKSIPAGLVTILIAAVVAAPAHATFPGTNGRIAFTTFDGRYEIASINPDGTDQRFLTNYPDDGEFPAWSADGQTIAYIRNGYDLYWMEADGSEIAPIDPQASSFGVPAWSPDGLRLVYYSNPVTGFMAMINRDGTGKHALAVGQDQIGIPAWAAAGADPLAIAGGNGIWAYDPDSPDPVQITNEGRNPDWSPDSSTIVYEQWTGGLATVRKGEAPVPIPGTSRFTDPVWSPDGTLIAATGPGGLGTDTEIYTMKPDGTDITRVTFFGGRHPSWQPLNGSPPPPPPLGYPRPRGATPMRISLVPEYVPCGGSNGRPANDSHGAPLSYPSCSPPIDVAQDLTMGTPDVNGAGAKSNGSIILRATVDDPSSFPDEADVILTASVTDVRCKYTIDPEPGTENFPCRAGAMADYTGDLWARPTVRITDRRNGQQGNKPATVKDLLFPFAIPCQATPDPTVGATCAVSTTFNSVLPGALVGGGRAIWAVVDVAVWDGGVDGHAVTVDDNVPFLTQGVFVP
jgi:hypothetical protein